MNLHFICPHCGQHLSGDVPPVGSEAHCPACAQDFRVAGAVVVKHHHHTPTRQERQREESRAKMMFLAIIGGSVVLLSLTRRFRSSSKNCVAAVPVSAIKSAASRSSYSASSICVPVKTDAMLLPVLRKPALSLSSQALRGGSVATATAAAAGTADAAATTGDASGDVAGGFFLKKLNING